jgi:hypothetical protein
MRNASKPRPVDPVCRVAAVLSVSAFALLLVDVFAPAVVTAPRIAGAPVAHLLPE